MHKQMKPTALLFLVAIFCCPLTGWAAGNCTVTANGVAFGAYNPLSSAAVDSSGTIDVVCAGPNNTVMSFSLSIPGNGAGSRYMSSSNSQLDYNLYTDTSRTQLWGDGASGTAAIPGSMTIKQGRTTATYYIYGRIPGGQHTARPGDYSAQLTVTVTY